MSRETEHLPTEASQVGGRGESQHSHFEYGSTHARWDREASSDFAITSVNVPDRLDTQEVRARAAADSSRPAVRRLHRDDVLRGIRWLLLIALAIAAGWWAVGVVLPLRAAISPTGVEAAIGKALGMPVSVADTGLRFSPSPRLVVTDITAQNGVRLPAITVHFNWRDALRGLQAASWTLGEARIAPVDLSGTQALALLRSVQGASELTAAISTVRFESVAVRDFVLLPGRYEAVIRRGVARPEFTSVSLRRLDGQGQTEIEITPPPAPDGSAQFALFARQWVAALGPGTPWNEATMQGEFRDGLLKVNSYSVGAPFGNFNGAAELALREQGWRLTGNVRAADLKVDELIRHAGGLGEGEAVLSRAPLRGTAKFDLAVSGVGATLEEVLHRTTASGRVSVSGAALAGLNLGLAATQGRAEGAGGTTQLTDLDFDLVASRDGLAVRNIAGRAGSLRVYGAFGVDRQLGLSGSLRPEVSSPRGVAGANVGLGGTATAPTYK